MLVAISSGLTNGTALLLPRHRSQCGRHECAEQRCEHDPADGAECADDHLGLDGEWQCLDSLGGAVEYGRRIHFELSGTALDEPDGELRDRVGQCSARRQVTR